MEEEMPYVKERVCMIAKDDLPAPLKNVPQHDAHNQWNIFLLITSSYVHNFISFMLLASEGGAETLYREKSQLNHGEGSALAQK
ncbi:hypothetical protein SLEP1_g7256 [Rubroshorea leprosula]|uniref:Uncharacterized protein n=1 Tax=Rubroshorea leprosula TaxID=152421 RepID=A0AAV5HXU4_9ROSI|nr:hypothetical protein SLEP1_g7256 [Rubroshorea leprosula]